MIISRRHRFVFYAIPKTGTHAIREALRPQLGPQDMEQQMLRGRQQLPVPALAALGHGHISWRQARAHLPVDVFENTLEFAFVRNPFDRFVSTCFFLNRGDPGFAARAMTFMKSAIADPGFRARVLVQPQCGFITDAQGQLRVDTLGRYEQLQASFDAVCRQLGLAPTALARTNSSAHEQYWRYYDAELEAAVRAFYRRDFELFGYPAHVMASIEAAGR